MDRSTTERSSTDRNTTTIHDETTELYRELDRLRNDLRQIRSDVSAIGGDALRTARAGFTETVRAANAQGKAAADGAARQIASHPFMAVATAFAIGLLLGARAGRRD